MTPLEEAVDAFIGELLRAPAVPTVRAMYARLIASGQMNWATLGSTLKSSRSYRERQLDPCNRDAVTDLIKTATGSRVFTGPFVGMRLIDLSSRGDGDLAPKLLGVYEQELHTTFSACQAQRYDAIVDVGCAEGYYAVGLARLFTATPVFAFDTDPAALDVLSRNAVLNDCSDRIVAVRKCDPASLASLYRRFPRTLVVSDCEGYEATLFTQNDVNALGTRADLVIECHDHMDAAITATLLAALSPSHDVMRIEQGARDANAFPFLASLDEWDRWRAVWERRGPRQHWLFCRSREPHNLI